MVTIDDDGQVFWELDDVFSRLALFPLTDDWIGEYPFEAPASWRDETSYFYYPIADDAIHAVHLHRLQRSPRDDETYLRNQKRFQFAMRERHDVRRVQPLREPFASQLVGYRLARGK